MRYQFEPRIFVMPAHFQFRVASDAIDRLWPELPADDLRFQNTPVTHLGFTLVNIGNGPAFRVQVATEYDFEKLFVDTRDKLSVVRPDIGFDHDGFGMTVTKDGKVLGAFRLPDQTAPTLDHVPSAAQSESKQLFAVDPSLSFFVMCQSCCMFLESKDQKIVHGLDPIPVTFRIKYLDTSGKPHVTAVKHEITFGPAIMRKDHSEGTGTLTLASHSAG